MRWPALRAVVGLAPALALGSAVLSCAWIAGVAVPPPEASPQDPADAESPEASDRGDAPGGTGAPDLVAPAEALPAAVEPTVPLPPSGPAAALVPPEAPPPAERLLRPAVVEDGEVLIRVGLASDLPGLDVPCCEAEATLTVDGEPLTLEAPFTVEPAAAATQAPEHRVQVAALRDQTQASELAQRLADRTGLEAEAAFDAARGLYRVRAGRFADRAEAQEARRRLAELGFGGAWLVEEGAALEDPALRVRSGERSFRVLGRWLALRPTEGESLWMEVPERSGRYRGELLVFLNDRGRLNLVNELALEQYLRGVVPKELGPELYPRLEALKAQAVAARTYALRHLGEFAAEGFDLCAEPRCQVYGGVGVEHPLSDRAVAATEGEVLLHDGTPVEALYSATCGGHTEDAELIFPWLDAPYLSGVPCPEGGPLRLAGSLPSGATFPAALTRRLVPPPEGETGTPGVEDADPGEAGDGGRAALEARLRQLARRAGLPETGDRLRSLEPGEVLRYVRSIFDLALDPRALDDGNPWPDVAAALPVPSADGGRVARAAETPVKAVEQERLILGLARALGLLREDTVRLRSLEEGVLGVLAPVEAEAAELEAAEPVAEGGRDALVALRRTSGTLQPDGGSGAAGFPGAGGAGLERHPVPVDLATFERDGAALVAADLDVVPGDPLVLYFWEGELAAVARDGVATAHRPDRHPRRASRLRSWQRFRTDARIASLVGERFPELGFRGFEVVRRGVSGRVGVLRLLGEAGRSELVEGLAVRWTLDLPDTRFDVERVDAPGREPGWLFTGGGWGHGVGMCQIGAYTLAGRGLGYRDILRHYYSGVELGRLVVRGETVPAG
ncbi:MAG: SpoIID/LytB domain-containing protein [Thermoanaerobaculia bacterium]